MIGNLTSRIGNRLSAGGLFLAATTFLIAVLINIRLEKPDKEVVKIHLGDLQVFSDFGLWIASIVLWGLSLTLLFLALGLFLWGIVRLWGALSRVRGGVDDLLLRSMSSLERAKSLMDGYFDGSYSLTMGSRGISIGVGFLIGGLVTSALQISIWAAVGFTKT